MPVPVRIPTVLRPTVGGESVVEAPAGRLGEVFADLERRYPDLGARLRADDGGLHPFVNVFVGDEDARYLGGLETPVADGVEVSIIPAVAGG